MKFKYSLLTFSFIQCCNKDVIIYCGASVSEFIRAIRSFISIDLWNGIDYLRCNFVKIYAFSREILRVKPKKFEIVQNESDQPILTGNILHGEGGGRHPQVDNTTYPFYLASYLFTSCCNVIKIQIPFFSVIKDSTCNTTVIL